MLNQLLSGLLDNTKATSITDDSVTYEWHPENNNLVVLRPYRKLNADEVRRVGDVLRFLGRNGTHQSVIRKNPKTGTLYGFVWQFPRQREVAPEMEALL